LRRKLLRLGRDAHGIEDMPAGRQITAESSWTDISQTSKHALADKSVFVVVVDHKNFIFIIDFCRDSAKQVNFFDLKVQSVAMQ